MPRRPRASRPCLGLATLVLAAAASAPVTTSAAERTLLAIGAHAGDVENTSGAILARHKRLGDRVVILHQSLARVRGAESGKRFATALEADPLAKRRVLDALP